MTKSTQPQPRPRPLTPPQTPRQRPNSNSNADPRAQASQQQVHQAHQGPRMGSPHPQSAQVLHLRPGVSWPQALLVAPRFPVRPGAIAAGAVCLPGLHSGPSYPVHPWGTLNRPCALGGLHSQGAGPQDLLGQQAGTWGTTSRPLRPRHLPSQLAGRQQLHLHPPPHSESASPTRARPEPSRPAHPLILTRLAARPPASQGMRVPRTTSRSRRCRPQRWPAAAPCPRPSPSLSG